MANWSKNNLAHRRTYLTLRILNQTRRRFDSAKSAEMNQLDFWVSGDSAAIRRGKARALASVINNIFVDAFKSTYEEGFNKTKSVNKLTTILSNSSKTINDLADVADSCYLFFGED